jgi:hypothetical protein
MWVFMLPWYAFRLWSWHRLNSRFAELRQPNAFSPHGQLAASFRECKTRLWIGVTLGAILWVFLAIGFAIRVLVER